MEIKILTIHCIHNFGSVFQAASLQQFLLNNGYCAIIIDYRPKYFNSGRNSIKTFVGRFFNAGAYTRRKNKFEAFIMKHMALTSIRYKKFNKLRSLDNAADIFIAGGDQLWNDYHFSGRDPAFKLSFVTKGMKMAFGTSMGRDNYTDVEIDALIPTIRDFRFIGLREKSSVEFLMSGGYENVSHVADPVLLMDRSFFKNVAIKPKIDRYALMYLVDKSPLLDAAVDYISEKLGLKIVHICGFKKKCKCDYFLKDSGPEEILGLLMDAEFVISASFHATLFSIMFNKNFVSLLPHENTNARITELLDHVSLKNRIINNEKDLYIISEQIDYEHTNEILDSFVDISRQQLINEIEGIMI